MNNIFIQIIISFLSSLIVVALYHVLIKKWLNKKEVESRLFELESAVRRISNDISVSKKSSISESSKSNGIEIVKGGKKKDKRKQDRNYGRTADSDEQTNTESRALLEEVENTSEVVEDNATPIIEEPKKAGTREVKYINLTISDGKLVEASIGQTTYYRSWHHKDKIFFEFYCERNTMKKAIYNRTAILDPCCNKDASSVLPDEANYIETLRPGELDSDFNIIKKATIKFIR